jgi:methionine-S-sulfoxide reductase
MQLSTGPLTFRSVAAIAAVLCILATSCTSYSATPGDSPLPDSSGNTPAAKTEEKIATFAGGCFWCTEAVFERMEGVNDVVSGYIGGHVENPTYEQVCDKRTGHAEAVEIYFDPAVASYEDLLEVFFKTHDPTTLNRQGNDEGPQYRSAVFYHDEAQRQAAEKYIEKLNKSGEYDRPIVTQLEKASKFYNAEEYHQDYFRRNPNAGYCQIVVKNKVRKFNREFGDKIKKPEKSR